MQEPLVQTDLGGTYKLFKETMELNYYVIFKNFSTNKIHKWSWPVLGGTYIYLHMRKKVRLKNTNPKNSVNHNQQHSFPIYFSFFFSD